MIAIEAENVLKIEFFAARPEVRVSEPLRDLKSELFSARLAADVNESVNDLARP